MRKFSVRWWVTDPLAEFMRETDEASGQWSEEVRRIWLSRFEEQPYRLYWRSGKTSPVQATMDTVAG